MSNVFESLLERLETFRIFIEPSFLCRFNANKNWLFTQIKAIHRNGQDEKE